MEKDAKEIAYMSNVKRVYVEKKAEFGVTAKELRHEVRHYLGISGVTGIRVLIRYDAENISEDTFEQACRGVFAEPPVDILYKEEFPMNEGDREIGHFLLSSFRDSSISAPIPRNSVSVLSGRMRSRSSVQQ